MPIYEYRCTVCGHEFEKLIRNSRDLPEECPECGCAPLKKLFSTFSPAVASQARTPCSEGGCPAASATGPPAMCADGKCPF